MLVFHHQLSRSSFSINLKFFHRVLYHKIKKNRNTDLVIFTNMSDYSDHDWDELPADVMKAAKVMGYTKGAWDGDKTPDSIKDKSWEDLTQQQKDAAKVLGYTERKWDSS